MKVSKGPRSSEEIGPIRISLLRSEQNGNWEIRIDDWKLAKNPHQIIPPSTGYTIFLDHATQLL